MGPPGMRCAHADCECEVEAKQAVLFDGKTYCSERCAEGRGCDHHDCNCGDFPTDEPEEPTP